MEEKNNEKSAALITQNTEEKSEGLISPFNNFSSFQYAWRMAKCLSMSNIMPSAFHGVDGQGQANCMIALELASRLRTSVFQIMQNLYIIQGRPAFSSQFIIASIQSCGRFSALKYKKRYDENGNIVGCRACATELKTGDEIEGPEVTLEMARAEGWSTKNGSKWRTMPEVMMMYRAASFFGRLYAPDIMMGFRSDEEVRDMVGEPTAADDITSNSDKTATLNKLAEEAEEAEEAVSVEPEREITITPTSARKRSMINEPESNADLTLDFEKGEKE